MMTSKLFSVIALCATIAVGCFEVHGALAGQRASATSASAVAAHVVVAEHDCAQDPASASARGRALRPATQDLTSVRACVR